MNKLGIIILNWDGYKDTIECINSLRNNDNSDFSIFLMDNGSANNSVNKINNWIKGNKYTNVINISIGNFSKLKKFDNNKIYFIESSENLGFAKGNNLIWKNIYEEFEYVLLLNNDTVIENNSINNMIEYMDNNPKTGVASCDIRLYSNPLKLWNAGGYFTWYGDRKYIKQNKIDDYINNNKKSIKTPFITGCVLLIRKNITEEYGFFTENFFFGEEDFNYCKRLQKNNVLIETILNSRIYHKVGSSINKTDFNQNRYILHFTNRIINLKEFYSPIYWYLWREFYIFAILCHSYKNNNDLLRSFKVAIKIKKYTSNYSMISKETFNEIMLKS